MFDCVTEYIDFITGRVNDFGATNNNVERLSTSS